MAAPTPHSLRVCFVLPRPERYSARSGGAIATVTRHVAEELTAAGDEVTIVTPDDGQPTYDTGRVVRLRPAQHRIWGRGRGFLHSRLTTLSRRDLYALDPYRTGVHTALRGLGQLDAVVVANDPSLAVAIGRSGQRTILWLHNQMSIRRDTYWLGLLPPSVRVITVSDAIRRWTAEHFGLPAHAMTVAHNGVDLEEFRPFASADPDRTPVRVVSHGRIDPNKGHDIVARAIAILRQRGAPVEYTLVGGVQTFGWADAAVSDYVASLDQALKDAEATTTGRVSHDKVARILADHEIACFIPRSEDPFPLATLEAMAAGCAIVVHPSGGLDEMVGDAGIRVGPDSPAEVADAIERLIGDRAALADARRAARRQAEQFTWAATAEVFRRVATDPA